VPPFLEARIHNIVRKEKPRRGWFFWNWLPIVATAAMALIGVTALVRYRLGEPWLSERRQESVLSSVSGQIVSLMRVGLRDHIHCAVFRNYPKKAPSTEEFLHEIGPQYAGLIPVVRSQIPASYQMTLAHQCVFDGRQYVHLSLKNDALKDDAHILSLLITRKGGGESFNAAGMVPALTQAGIPMYQSGVGKFQIAAFETRDYLVYFISDLSLQENTRLMLAMSPQVNSLLTKLQL